MFSGDATSKKSVCTGLLLRLRPFTFLRWPELRKCTKNCMWLLKAREQVSQLVDKLTEDAFSSLANTEFRLTSDTPPGIEIVGEASRDSTLRFSFPFPQFSSPGLKSELKSKRNTSFQKENKKSLCTEQASNERGKNHHALHLHQCGLQCLRGVPTN